MNIVLYKGIIVFVVLLVVFFSFTPAFALTELQRITTSDSKLVNAFGAPIGNNVNVDQQIQISAKITNNQEISQNIVYLVQIKDKTGFVISLKFMLMVESMH